MLLVAQMDGMLVQRLALCRLKFFIADAPIKVACKNARRIQLEILVPRLQIHAESYMACYFAFVCAICSCC